MVLTNCFALLSHWIHLISSVALTFESTIQVHANLTACIWVLTLINIWIEEKKNQGVDISCILRITFCNKGIMWGMLGAGKMAMHTNLHIWYYQPVGTQVDRDIHNRPSDLYRCVNSLHFLSGIHYHLNQNDETKGINTHSSLSCSVTWQTPQSSHLPSPPAHF